MNSNTKTFGGLGSLFIVLAVIPYVGTILGLIGFILLAIAIKKFADSQNLPELFGNFVKGIVIYIAGVIVGIIFGVGSILTLAQHEGGSFLTYALMVIALLITYGATIAGAYFMKQVFEEMGEITKNNLFNWGGKLLFWGAILTIIIVGAIVSWIGWIILTVAFFTTEEKKEGRDGEAQGAG